MIKRTRDDGMSGDIERAMRLEEHARNRMATNQERPYRSWFEPTMPWSVWILVTIGASSSVLIAVLLFWPLVLMSWHWWRTW